MREHRIRAVRLHGYRGATIASELRFDCTKPVVLLFGENGRGKSSVVDAIDAACNGDVGSVRDRSSTRTREHLPSLGKTPTELRIEVETECGTWRTTLAGDQLVTSPAWDGAPVFVLRRARMLKLVDAEPADRYKVLERFIDVSLVERSEQALADAVRSTQADVNQIATAHKQAAAILEEHWIRAGRPGAPEGSALAWAASESDVDFTNLDAKIAKAQMVAELAAGAQQALHVYEQAAAHLATATAVRDAAAKRLAELSRLGYGRLIVDVLTSAERLLSETTDVTECPVCEQPVRADDLRAAVAQRLGAARAVRDAMHVLEQTTRVHADAGRTVTGARATLARAGQTLAAELTADSYEGEIREGVRTLCSDAAPDAIHEAALVLARYADTLRTKAHARTTKMGERRGAAQAIRTAYDTWVTRTREHADASALLARLRTVQAVVREERIAVIDGVLDAVRDECNRLYARIHPNERAKLQRLRVTGRRSLHHDAHFEGTDGVPPQAYFSESHLDTFAFCFWLAIVKHACADGTPPVVVLDDAFTSVDAPHGRRIFELLLDEAASMTQLVIATHQRAWADAVQRGRVANQQVGVVSLHRWSFAKGIGSSVAEPSLTELRALLDASDLDRQKTAALSGVLLEATLDHLAQVLGAPMARGDDPEYSFEAYRTALTPPLRSLQLHDVAAARGGGKLLGVREPLPLLEGALALTVVRNQVGCHFDLDGLDLPDETCSRSVRGCTRSSAA